VLYQCPHCGTEFSMLTAENTITCSSCGFTQTVDAYGFFHHSGGPGEEVRLVSNWSRLIHDRLAEKIAQGEEQTLSCKAEIRMVDNKRHKFTTVGSGTVTLQPGKFLLEGTIGGQEISKEISVLGVPTLPFSPGKHLELQDGNTIYRCVLEDGKLVMKFINMVKIFYARNQMKMQEKVS